MLFFVGHDVSMCDHESELACAIIDSHLQEARRMSNWTNRSVAESVATKPRLNTQLSCVIGARRDHDVARLFPRNATLYASFLNPDQIVRLVLESGVKVRHLVIQVQAEFMYLAQLRWAK